MIAGIITILSALVPLIAWLIKRHLERADDPLRQNRKRYETIDGDIARGNSLDATAHADADLDELERLQRAKGDQRGPG